MPRPAQFRPLPLPRNWSRHVRSAVIHVISLARTSLALSQGWASESMNPELRVGDVLFHGLHEGIDERTVLRCGL
jgi:hypothetical protein